MIHSQAAAKRRVLARVTARRSRYDLVPAIAVLVVLLLCAAFWVGVGWGVAQLVG